MHVSTNVHSFEDAIRARQDEGVTKTVKDKLICAVDKEVSQAVRILQRNTDEVEEVCANLEKKINALTEGTFGHVSVVLSGSPTEKSISLSFDEEESRIDESKQDVEATDSPEEHFRSSCTQAEEILNAFFASDETQKAMAEIIEKKHSLRVRDIAHLLEEQGLVEHTFQADEGATVLVLKGAPDMVLKFGIPCIIQDRVRNAQRSRALIEEEEIQGFFIPRTELLDVQIPEKVTQVKHMAFLLMEKADIPLTTEENEDEVLEALERTQENEEYNARWTQILENTLHLAVRGSITDLQLKNIFFNTETETISIIDFEGDLLERDKDEMLTEDARKEVCSAIDEFCHQFALPGTGQYEAIFAVAEKYGIMEEDYALTSNCKSKENMAKRTDYVENTLKARKWRKEAGITEGSSPLHNLDTFDLSTFSEKEQVLIKLMQKKIEGYAHPLKRTISSIGFTIEYNLGKKEAEEFSVEHFQEIEDALESLKEKRIISHYLLQKQTVCSGREIYDSQIYF